MVANLLRDTVALALLDKVPNSIIYYTPVFGDDQQTPIDFQVRYCNDLASKEANAPVSDLVGKRTADLVGDSPQAAGLVFRQLLEVYQSGEESETVFFNPKLDKFFRVHRSKVDEGVLSVSQNITGEIREQQEREKQKQLTDLMLENALNAWYIIDAVRNENGEIYDFVFRQINRHFTEVIGLKEVEVVGKSLKSLFPTSAQNGMFELYLKTLDTGNSEHQQVHYQDEERDAWYEVVLSRVDSSALLVSFADVTQYQKALHELQAKSALLDNVLLYSANGISVSQVIRNGDGIVIDARTILANEAAVRFIGLPREIYLGKTAVELEPNIVESPYFKMCVHTLETGEPAFVRYPMESTGRWLELSVSRMDAEHIITIFTDITAGKEAQLQQERLVEELKKSNQSLKEFTRAASHDLKEPIRKVQFFVDRLELIKEGQQASEVEKDAMSRIKKATARMRTLVDDLLDYAQLDAKPNDAEDVDLNKKVKTILSDLELLIQEKGAVIELKELPRIKGYRRQIEQVFQNLVSNALKYTNAGRVPHIEISSSIVTAEETGLAVATLGAAEAFHLVKVRDNGIGFPTEDAERIFQVFTRLHGNAEYSGTGIGLSIVKKVLENHGGFVYAEGVTGEGACFNLLFPVA